MGNPQKMELMGAAADASIQIHPHVAGVTPMYRIRLRGYRSQWSAAPHGMTPRQFVLEHTGMDMAAVQSVSRIFIEYAFSVEFRVFVPQLHKRRPSLARVRIADQKFPTDGYTKAHARPVVDAFVRRHAEKYGLVAPMQYGYVAAIDAELFARDLMLIDADRSDPYSFIEVIGGAHEALDGRTLVVPLEGCSFCARDTNIRRVGYVNSCLNEDGTCTRGELPAAIEMHVALSHIRRVGVFDSCLVNVHGARKRELLELREMYVARARGAPIRLPSAPALTDPPSEFDPPHVERLRLLHAMALCMQRAPHQTAPLAAGLALATSEFRGMVADALASRVVIFG